MKLAIPFTEILKSIPGIIGIHFGEKPRYELIEEGNVEIRRYPPMTLLSRTEKGRHEWAVNKAFTRLASFIFSHAFSMTIPVFQQKYQDGVKLSFYIPDHIDLPAIPSELKREETPERMVAVFQYNGFNYPTAMDEAREELELHLTERDDLRVIGDAFYAQYDAPSTIPFLRKNEVLIEVERSS